MPPNTLPVPSGRVLLLLFGLTLALFIFGPLLAHADNPPGYRGEVVSAVVLGAAEPAAPPPRHPAHGTTPCARNYAANAPTSSAF